MRSPSARRAGADVDATEARQVLGLGDGPISERELRDARNAALKAHHPDVAGTDEAAGRRATYWSSRINEAYDLLRDRQPDDRESATDLGPSRQSFSAAAARAADRAAADELEANEAADRQRQAEHAEAERRAAEQAASGRAAAERDAARREAIRSAVAPPATTAPGTRSDPWTRPAIAIAAIAMLVCGVALWAATMSPSRAEDARAASARAQPSPTPTPSVQTMTPAAGTARDWFTAWKANYDYYLVPCYSAGSCSVDQQLTFEDGSGFVLSTEVKRVVELFRDSRTLDLNGDTTCREEFANGYALMAALSAEIELLDAKRSDEEVPDSWRPMSLVAYEDCGAPGPWDDVDPDEALAEASRALKTAEKAVERKDWASAAEAGDSLTFTGLDLARVGATLPTTGQSSYWRPLRTLGWDLIRIGGRLQVPRLADSEKTRDLLEDSTKVSERLGQS